MLPNPRVSTEDLSKQERESLILKHLPQVRLLARKIHSRLPENVSLEDLVSAGIVGLISAVDRFDRSRHVSLGSYAEHKITGGMLDSLRRLDWASRLLRKRAKQMEAAIAVVEQRWQRAPTEQEIAKELNITVERYRQWQTDVCGLNVGALEAPESEDSDQRDQFPSIPGDPSQLPSAVLERRELQRALATAISELPEKHQAILSMYYRDELTLREIGKIVGVHESRIYQIRSQPSGNFGLAWPNCGPMAGAVTLLTNRSEAAALRDAHPAVDRRAVFVPLGDLVCRYGIHVSERSVPRMNTMNKKDQKNQRQKTRQKRGQKKHGQALHDERKYQEHEHPETRLTR